MPHNLKSWRPFTHILSAPAPIELAYAKDTCLVDRHGHHYIDAIASWWVITHGHCHPHITNAISKTAQSLDQVVFANFTHAPARALLDKLSDMLPHDFAAAFFSDNGSTSVEVALKMALQYWQIVGCGHKNKIVSFAKSYHGDTAGCMSVSARGLFTNPYQAMLFDVVEFSDAFASLTDDTAAIIVEPLVQGAGGMIMWDHAYLRSVVLAARAKNIVVIFDEVMTGFYRTGSLFAFLELEFIPDILCLSKGLTGGALPLALTLCNHKVYDAFAHGKRTDTFFHGHTFTANPISCAAALANLELMNQETAHRVCAIEQKHRQRIADLKSPLIKDKRMRGTIAAIELHDNEGYLSTISSFIAQFAFKHGVFLRTIGNVIYFMPPFCITDAQLEQVWQMIDLAIRALEKR